MVERASLNVDYGLKRVNYRYCVKISTDPEITEWCNKNIKPYRWFYVASAYYFTVRKNAIWFELRWI